jgi:hypothetical protein
MKAKWMMLTIMILFFLASLIGCGPRVRLVPENGGISRSPQTSPTSPPIVTQPGESAKGTEAQISPTQDITGKLAMDDTPLALPVYGKAARESVEFARQNLAERLGLPVESISVATVIGQEFTPNGFYCQTTKDRIARDDAPATISGWSILLSASGRRYEYHASGQTVIFCRTLP